MDSIVDDGAVIYLNGQEVSRLNMPEGPIDFATPAASSVRDAEFTGEVRLAATQLQVGRNVLAVEVHQSAAGVGPGETPPRSVLEIDATPGFSMTWNGKDGEFFDAASPPNGAIVPNNVALASQGATAFASSDLGPEIGTNYHVTANLNDGYYGNANSWIGGSNNPFRPIQFAGIRFAQATRVQSIAWGRDNGNSTSDACGGQCTDRSLGTYTLQYTMVPTVGSDTVDTGDAATGWATIGTVNYRSDQDTQAGDGFTTFLRHEYDVRQNGQPIDATGIRILVPGTGLAGGTAIDEIEVFTTATVTAPDVVFGASLTATEVLPETPQIFFSEVTAASANNAFVELSNVNPQAIDLSGYTIASSNPAATAVSVGWDDDSGGRSADGDARLSWDSISSWTTACFCWRRAATELTMRVRIEDRPRARSPQHEGRWLTPDKATPGTANSFALEQDIVINEILYHAPGTATSAVPATYEATTLLPIDDDTIWRYRADGRRSSGRLGGRCTRRRRRRLAARSGVDWL